ncbi:MAG TPA: valine--tRNA ligase [Gammaproteobacteria bacterium]|nr:valine--tRNA ligase [Gammaproteobacteria bacterium]
MEKAYEPRGIEDRWYARWESQGWFSPQSDAESSYCILLPPPNVTGTLHMGHAFQQTLMDALIRYQRMRGASVLWQGGTDHAGIATQKIVENQLAAEGKTRHDLGREKFIERVWAWKEESGSVITRQMRRLGASCDWSRERFTMDAGLSAAVLRVFIQWYRDGLLYRGKRLVHWDPVLQTAVSDLEVNNEERDGHLWLIRYPAADGGEGLVVATTRPETMLGDVAVAVHPEDARYQRLIGKKLKLPLTDRQIPVVADDYVDKEFGTGAVKSTPAHDFNDYALAQRHKLPILNIFTLDAKTNDSVPAAYRGLDRFAARKKVIADLEAQGLLVETKKHKLMVPISQRSDAVIEPMLTDQWFLDLTSDKGRRAITEPALDAVRSGKIKFTPENWSTTYLQWLENIQDWCVSRQLWWGHRIPAWFDEAGNIFVGESEADALKHAKAKPVGNLRQDEDVLDTWFSSALWPFSTLGWPGDTSVRAKEWKDFERFLPSSVLVTGFDIIFFWVARMVMASLYFVGRKPDGSYEPERAAIEKRVPFREVYINAIVRDAEGQKMSKSKGNTIDPLDLIDGIGLEALVKKSTESLLLPKDKEKVERRVRRDYPQGIPPSGADALRFTFASLATYGRTINFDLKRCEGYRNFCNKLWNASRYVLMNTEGYKTSEREPACITPAEKWIVSRLHDLCDGLEENFKSYRFDLVAQDLYEFTWNDFCDWFVELSKPDLNSPDPKIAASTRHTLLYVLENLLRALHPLVPFITEELWQQVAPRLGINGETISLRRYPSFESTPRPGGGSNSDIEWLLAAVPLIRGIRSQNNISPTRSVPLIIELPADGGSPVNAEIVDPYLRFLAKLESITRVPRGKVPSLTAMTVLDEVNLHIPLAGLIDAQAERERLGREIEKARANLARCEQKLGNASFVSGAPSEVVAKERGLAEKLRNAVIQLEKQREALPPA